LGRLPEVGVALEEGDIPGVVVPVLEVEPVMMEGEDGTVWGEMALDFGGEFWVGGCGDGRLFQVVKAGGSFEGNEEEYEGDDQV
jgi:hypothetical protein